MDSKMNERIYELAEQAYINVITTKGMENIADGCYIVSPDKLEKFAELIVRECARIVNENDFEGSIVGDGMLFEHFGVEE
jgi:hypothetical protein